MTNFFGIPGFSESLLQLSTEIISISTIVFIQGRRKKKKVTRSLRALKAHVLLGGSAQKTFCSYKLRSSAKVSLRITRNAQGLGLLGIKEKYICVPNMTMQNI